MKKKVLLIAVVLLYSLIGMGQISGTKTIPGDYSSVAAAIADLNTSGVGTGGVTFNISAGYTETFASRTDGLITATGTSASPIIFQKSGAGTNPLITAATPGIGNYDYIFCIGGGDYITFDGINVQDNPANTTPATQMEYGFALLKASGTDGAQYNTLKNGSISMSTNVNAYGIYLDNWSYTAPGTQLTVTAVSGSNSWNKFYSLNLNNCYGGINLKGFADVEPYAFYDQGIEIGVDGGNYFNYAAMTGTTTNSYGINTLYQNGLVIANNMFSGSISVTTGRYYAMNLLDAHNADLDVFNNTLSISFTGTGHFYGFYINGELSGQYGRTNTVNFYNNQVINNTFPNHTSGNVVYTYVTVSSLNLNIYGNLISNNAIGSTTANSTGLVYYAYYRSNPAVPQTGAISTYNNTISNNTRSSAAATVTSLTYFLLHSGQTNTFNLYGNVIDNNTAIAGNAYGIMIAHIGANKNIYNNQITNISGRCAALYGISNANGIQNTQIHNNLIQNLSSSGNPNASFPTLYSVYGINQFTGNNTHYFNNYISQLYAPFSTSSHALIGIRVAGLNNNFTGLYNNTIYLDGTSANDGFGARGIYAETGSELDMRNNNVVVNSVPTGEYGCNVAFYRTDDNLNTYQQVSNNNNFYAGTPGSRNFIYMALAADSLQTLEEYQALVFPRDAQSISELPPFVNVTTSPYDLHLENDVITKCESGGTIISSPLAITTDYDGNPRYPNPGYPDNPLSPAIAPDIGADEFAGIYADLIPPNIDYTPLISTSVPGERTLTAVITDPSGVPTSGTGLPVLYWKINNGSWMSSTASWTSGYSYTFTFGGGAVLNDVVYYFVAAQDNAPTHNVGCRPIGGAGGFTSNPPACSIPPTHPDEYTIVGTLCGTYTVGTGMDYPTITAAIADLNTKEVVCPVVFELWDETYSTSETFPLVIYPYLGASADRTVTFRPKPAGSVTVSGSSNTGILVLQGCQFITIDGSNSGGNDRSLTWENTSTAANSFTIGLFNEYPQGASNCVISNNNIKSSAQLTSNTYGIFLDPAWGGFDNIIIDNNKVISARNGIQFSGKWNNKAYNGRITNNIIGSLTPSEEIKFQGIVVVDAVNTLIRGNEIIGPVSGNTNTNQAGILLSPGADYTEVDQNMIYGFNSTNANGRVSAINLATQSSETLTAITNNIIFGMKAGRYPSGIYLSSGGSALIAHNTVSLTDTTFTSAAPATFYSSCLDVGSSSVLLDVRNNIFMNRQQCVNPANVNPKTYAVYCSAPSSAFTDINYNDYFVNEVVAPSGLSGRTGYLTIARNSLADWQAATGKDVQSTVTDPVFVLNGNLEPTNAALNNLGVYLPQLPVDFSGDLRTDPPDMGANNFGNDPAILTGDVSGLAYSSAVLNGTALAADQSVNLYFDLGTTLSYGTVLSGTPSVANGLSPVPFNATASGLNPNTLYHFRARGVAATGLIVFGADETFTTDCLYPVASVSGTTAICAGAMGLTYTTEAGHMDYFWTVSPGGEITSGQGTHSITVDWNASGAQTVNVTYTTIYGCPAQSPGVLNVTVHPNPAPTITGAASSCVGYSGVVYSTQAEMASYTWTLGSGGTITSGQGTHQINVAWNAPGTHTLSVIFTTVNGCSAGVPTSYDVIVYTVDQPTISGAGFACANAGVYMVYSTETGMSNYLWNVSSGGTIVSGQGTSQIEVNWTSAGSHSVSVNYANSNGCSAVNPTVFPVTVNSVPAPAGPVSGDQEVCEGTTGVEYSCTPITGAATYHWTVPQGASIVSGSGTSSIIVDFPSGASSGTITVFGTNACGAGAVSPAFSVTINPVPSAPVVTAGDAQLTSSSPEGNQWYFEGVMIPGATEQTYEATQTGWYWAEVTLAGCTSDTSNHVYVLITGIHDPVEDQVTVYPVPNDGRFMVNIKNPAATAYAIKVVNAKGEVVFEQQHISGLGELRIPVDIGKASAGIYLLIIENEDIRIIRKVVIW